MSFSMAFSERVRFLLRECRGAYRSSPLYELRHASASSKILRAGLGEPTVKLHLGSGPKILPGWINIDVKHYPGVVVLRLPMGLKRIPDSSVSFVYCSHMFEHIDYPHDVHVFATEIRRVLKPQGAMRMVVPGIERIIRAYVAGDREFFMEQERHHPPSCTTKLEHLMYALQQDGEHKYGYDFETAKKFLNRAGFEDVVESSYNGSQFHELRVDYRGENLSLFIDAVKH